MNTYLYKSRPGLGPINLWTRADLEGLMEPLGSAESVKKILEDLFVGLEWSKVDNTWFGGHRICTDPYIDILLEEDGTGQCKFIGLNKPAESVVRHVMKIFRLNYACTPENGGLVELPRK